MYWNHRVVKMNDDEGTLLFAEVFYDDDGTAVGYTEPFMSSDTVEGMRGLLNRLAEALDEPVLDAEGLRKPTRWVEEEVLVNSDGEEIGRLQ